MKKHWLDTADFFGTPVQGLNFEGRLHIGTWVGLTMTILLIMIQGLYTGLKFSHLITSYNPQISVSQETGVYYDEAHALDISNYNFTVAFGVSDYLTGDTKYAGNLVDWLVEIVETDGNESGANTTRYKLKYHICTDEDRKKFFRPRASSKTMIDNLFSGKGMYCLDKLDWYGEKVLLYGKDDVMQNRRLDISLVACNPDQLTKDN
jgi:hypothetical protein